MSKTRVKQVPLDVGERRQNNRGDWYTIISISGCKNIVVEFDSHSYRKTTTRYLVEHGILALPSWFVGDVVKDNQGVDVTITAIAGVKKMTFRWPDGVERVCQASVLHLGTLVHPENSQKLNPKVKVGQVYKTKLGGEVEVVEVKGSAKILVEFKQPKVYRVYTNQSNLTNGNINNKYSSSVLGVGSVHGCEISALSKCYRSWYSMLERCYAPKNNRITYLHCTVDASWLELKTFNIWFCKQTLGDSDWHLDKDLLIKGNKKYSEETCIFLPRELNSFPTNRFNHRGDWPVGVTFHERLGKWQASCSTGGHKNSEYLGLFSSPGEAFNVYKIRKESYAKELAAKWQSQIDPRAYQALMNYTVNITD